MENVPNLVRHRQGRTWKTIIHRLRLAGYSVDDRLLSPHQFGVPQIRERAFIVGRRGETRRLFLARHPSWTLAFQSTTYWTQEPVEAKPLPQRFINYLEVWQEFLDRLPNWTRTCLHFRYGRWNLVQRIPIWDGSPYGVGLAEIEIV